MILSIIIPVYNVEKYIVGCLKSIYSQGADNSLFEVVIVNDGTKDHSVELVQSIIDENNNCTLINQVNQGLSAARNSGLNFAKGDYVWFVDSDDQVVPGVLNEILSLLQNRKEDVIAFNVTYKDELTGSERLEMPSISMKQSDDFNQAYTSEQSIGKFQKGLVQRYIIRRDFLAQYHLEFLKGVWYEDDQLLVRLFCYNKNIFLSSIRSYIYLQRNCGSIMSSRSIRSVKDSDRLIESWKAFLTQNKLGKIKRQWVCANIFKYHYFILSLQKQVIDGYDDYMKGSKVKRKLEMLKYLVLGQHFISSRNIIKAFLLCLSTKLIN